MPSPLSARTIELPHSLLPGDTAHSAFVAILVFVEEESDTWSTLEVLDSRGDSSTKPCTHHYVLDFLYGRLDVVWMCKCANRYTIHFTREWIYKLYACYPRKHRSNMLAVHVLATAQKPDGKNIEVKLQNHVCILREISGDERQPMPVREIAMCRRESAR